MSARHGLLLVLASFAVYLIPTIAVVCIGLFLSAVTRNTPRRWWGRYLLTTQFQPWHASSPGADRLPIGRAAWVCAIYAVPKGIAAYLIFLRRDVAGG